MASCIFRNRGAKHLNFVGTATFKIKNVGNVKTEKVYDAILAKYKDKVVLNYPEKRKRNKLPAKLQNKPKVTSNAPK